jgi:hypothetical protein
MLGSMRRRATAPVKRGERPAESFGRQLFQHFADGPRRKMAASVIALT